MDIVFRTKKLEKQLAIQKNLIRKHGAKRARLLGIRLTQLRAVATLLDLTSLPQIRCHELSGQMEGLLSVDLDGPHRLIFSPANNPAPEKPDGGLDWARVSAICIEGIEDTHG